MMTRLRPQSLPAQKQSEKADTQDTKSQQKAKGKAKDTFSLEKFEKWLKKNTIIKPSSMRQYLSQIARHKQVIDRAIKDKDVEVINHRLVEHFRKYNSNTLKPAIVQYLKFRKRPQMVLDLVKLKSKPRKRIPNWFKPVDLLRFINSLDPETRLILQIQYYTVARVGEILRVKADNVIRREDGYYIMTHTKTNQARIAKIPEELAEAVLARVRKDRPFVFIEPSNADDEDSVEVAARSRYNRISEEFSAKSEAVLGRKANTHDIRRSIAEHEIVKDKSLSGIRRAQQLLGHGSLATTFIYFKRHGILDE